MRLVHDVRRSGVMMAATTNATSTANLNWPHQEARGDEADPRASTKITTGIWKTRPEARAGTRSRTSKYSSTLGRNCMSSPAELVEELEGRGNRMIVAEAAAHEDEERSGQR